MPAGKYSINRLAMVFFPVISAGYPEGVTRFLYENEKSCDSFDAMKALRGGLHTNKDLKRKKKTYTKGPFTFWKLDKI